MDFLKIEGAWGAIVMLSTMKIMKRWEGVGEDLLSPLTVTNTGMEMVHNTAHAQFINMTLLSTASACIANLLCEKLPSEHCVHLILTQVRTYSGC